MLHGLSDALLEGVPPEQLQDAVRHAWVLADLGEVDEGLVRTLLRNLGRDLRTGGLDRSYYARQLQNAMDRLT